jgi:diguanylate cyclase (GGDEF)-like protein
VELEHQMKKVIRLLSVEDDLDDIYIIQQFLKHDLTTDFVFDYVTNLSDASNKLQTDHFDVVLLDLRLPDGQGKESIIQLTRQFPNLPIIVVTDHDSVELESSLISAGAEDYLNKSDLSNKLLSRVIRLSIERKQLQAKLEESTLKDDLTGLYSRKNFYLHLNALIAQAERNPIKIALAFLDLDDFKEINDNYGHIVGDDVLRKFSEFLTSRIRESDIAARLGGDEFALVICHYESIENLNSFLLRNLNNGEANLTIDNMGEQLTLPIHFSIGIKTWQPGDTTDQLIQHADLDMYKTKKKRKSRSNK